MIRPLTRKDVESERCPDCGHPNVDHHWIDACQVNSAINGTWSTCQCSRTYDERTGELSPPE